MLVQRACRARAVFFLYGLKCAKDPVDYLAYPEYELHDTSALLDLFVEKGWFGGDGLIGGNSSRLTTNANPKTRKSRVR